MTRLENSYLNGQFVQVGYSVEFKQDFTPSSTDEGKQAIKRGTVGQISGQTNYSGFTRWHITVNGIRYYDVKAYQIQGKQ